MMKRRIQTQWSVFCLMLGMYGVLSHDPEFVAPVNPCRDQDVICPITCRLMRMSGSTNCEFCFCTNPLDSAWPDPTTTVIPTTSTTIALPPGHSIVNNVHYVELKNPCVLSNAMCPLKCIRSNVTMDTGRTCERCECPDIHHRLDSEQSIVVGKREESKGSMIRGGISKVERNFLNRQQVPGHQGQEMMHHEFWNRPCMPFFTCPIFSCPPGQHMPVKPNGCRICQCVDRQGPNPSVAHVTKRPTTTMEPTAPPTTIDPAKLLEMFCLPKEEDCPSSCHVTDYRVGSWNCYHCSCPDGQTFVALQNPCDVTSSLCPSNCSITDVEEFSKPTSCQVCDCVKASPANQRIRNLHFAPGHNTHVAFSGPVQGGNGFDNSQQIPNGIGFFYSHTHESSSQLPSQDHVTLAKTTTEPGPTEDPEHLCLTNENDCPTQICILRTIGQNCHLCQCGDIYFRDADVGKFKVLVTKPTTLSQTTTAMSTSTSTTSPINVTPLTHAPSTARTMTHAPSVIIPVTQTSTKGQHISVTHTVASTSCYKCNETDCKSDDLDACAPGKDFCMNTITQDRNGLRKFKRECVGEEDCYDKWWIQSMNNPVCLGMYNTEKGPLDQPEVCYFCCKGPSCNSAARIEDYNLYTGGEHVIG
ncbi:uncharacterized protein LOC117315413 isoform X2 [Pecten maximus]|uniref:uncharacterized protein LOC117315413 isoform X2 n=1 Tax=Pecten maximus TaxID=6579 RepID=UPI001458A49D|nr:uncharacterized protein LOC117315413 isoform X2 [Pecten maximus]